MHLEVKGKKVLVQGASTGIGFAIAKAYAEAGAIVAISSSSKEKISHAASQIKATAFVCDAFQEGSGSALVWQVLEKLGGLDIVVTNTVNPPKKFFMETSLEEWKKSFQSLLMNAVETILEAIPPMKEQKYGRIIFSTSTAAKEPSPSLTLSSTFRGGLLTLMKSLSQELAPYQITVNALLPGFIKTTMLVERFNNLEDIAATIPSKRLGLPEEIASLALFLGSKQASYITGQAIACDGGLLKGL